jgi:hypothetical protein
MLKPTNSSERLVEMRLHFIKLASVSTLIAYGGCLLLYALRRGDSPPAFTILLFVVFCMIPARIVAVGAWRRAAFWLFGITYEDGVAAMQRPNANPRLVDRVLEGWWRNEIVLDAFSLVLRVTICVTLYALLGPHIGLL